jgi:hypothetical protein
MFDRSGLMPYGPLEGPKEIGNIWVAFKESRRLVCALSTHSLGWELRLMVMGGMFIRTEVCKTQTQVFELADQWKQDAVARGWRER